MSEELSDGVHYDTGLWMLLGLSTFFIWYVAPFYSAIIGFFTYILCSYYSHKWKVYDKYPCIMASIMWLGTLLLWYRIYRMNEHQAKMRMIGKIMES